VKKLTVYMRQNKGLFTIGIFMLFGGSLAEFAVPAYIGLVIDELNNGGADKMQTINTYVLELFLMITVSYLFYV
jgi:ABC-type multidrug transport system fused ATPase/permease subunit